MAENEAIDIFQEFVDLYAREDMLGFFGFTLPRPDAAPVSGLCRMSKPKGGESMAYVSLTFVVDTPDDAVRGFVQGALERVDGDRLKARAPGVADVVSVPVMGEIGESYVNQIDVLLAGGVEPDHRFVGGTLLPALREQVGLVLGEIVWWDEPGAPGAAKAAAVAALSDESLLRTLKTYLGSYLKPAKK